MKAVIAIPPVLDFYFTPSRASALGARVLERELIEAGWSVTLLNFPVIGKNAVLPLPESLGYLRKFMIPEEYGPLSWFTAFHRFGPDFEQAAALIEKEAPDRVFISSFAWAYAEEAVRLARALSHRIPDIPLVIGGHGPTSLPEYFLRQPHPGRPGRRLFALVVSGEIEGHLNLLVKALAGEEGYLNLRDAPVPEMLRPIAGESVTRGGRRSISISLTRGCPRTCRFCSNHICHGRHFRCAPESLWEQEVERAADGHEKILLNFEDDNIMVVPDAFRRFTQVMKERYPEVKFTAENGLDYSLLSEDDLDWMKEVGFLHLNLSLGVFSRSARIRAGRHGDPLHLERLTGHAGRIDLGTTTHFISGMDGEQPGDILETLKFVHNLPTRAGISSFYPVPGLPGFTDPGLFLRGTPRMAAGSSMYPWNGSLTTAQMLTAFRLSRWSNFRKGLSGKRSGPGSESAREMELEETVLRHRRLYTTDRKRGVIQVNGLDDSMQEDFFTCRR